MNEVDLADMINNAEDDDNLHALVLFRLLPKDMCADVFSYLDSDVQEYIVNGINDKELSAILEELYLDDTVDFVDEMPSSIAKRVLMLSDSETRKRINQFLHYPEDSAGSLMTIEYMSVKKDWTVAKTLLEIRRRAEDKEDIQTLYVSDSKRVLSGMLDLTDVLAASDETILEDIMDTEFVTCNTTTDQAEVAEMFKKYDLISMPVVDKDSHIVGIITIDDIVDVIEEETTEDIYKMAAMAPIDDSYMETGVFSLAKKRIVWLLILMISATFTGLIIQNYSTIISTNVILASFMPMLMDTSGNAGSQASVSIIRGLVLGEVEPKDIAKVIWKEFRVSILVGVIIAFFNFIRMLIMYKDIKISLVVSITLFFVIIAAKFVGCTLPLIATKLKLDPALMASPMITTIVDAVALIVYFKIASVFLGI